MRAIGPLGTFDAINVTAAQKLSGWLALLALYFAFTYWTNIQQDDTSFIYRLWIESIWAAGEFAIMFAIHKCADWPGLCAIAFGSAIIAIHIVSFTAAMDCLTRYGLASNYWLRYTCWPAMMPMHVLIVLGGIALCLKPSKA